MEYEDIADRCDVEMACFPALGSRRNDIGAFGGPHSKWPEILGPTTGVENHQEIIPGSIYLSQNYPNPFNPATTIKYSIPARVNSESSIVNVARNGQAFVKLIVYDLLGEEVATLISEEQIPGEYEITWDAGQYPSGVYFYKLSVDDYSITKKLVLLK